MERGGSAVAATSRATAAVAAAAALVVTAAAAGLVIYQQRGTLFGSSGYSDFEKKYAAQLKASRRHVVATLADGSNAVAGGGAAAHSSAGADAELSSLATVKVIYGSDSGNAEAFAKGLVGTLNDRGVSAARIDPSRWPHLDRYQRLRGSSAGDGDKLFDFPRAPAAAAATTTSSSSNSRSDTAAATPAKENIVLFIVATAGEGEATANFASLLREMQSAVAAGGSGPFSNVRYAVFALGDRSYKYYCRAGMTVNTILKKGGGSELHPLGFGDASTGTQEAAFERWQDGVIRALQEKCGVRLTDGSLDPPKPQAVLVTFPPSAATSSSSGGSAAVAAVQLCSGQTGSGASVSAAGEKLPRTDSSDSASGGGGSPSGPPPFPSPPPLLEPTQHRPGLVRLVRREWLTPVRDDDGSAVCRLTFSLAGANMSYQAGDHFAVRPVNPTAAVDRAAALLGLSAAELAMEVELQEPLTRTAMANTLPARVTLHTALSYYPDLCGRPKRSALRVLAKYCSDDAEKRAFLAAIDDDGAAETNGSGGAGGDVSPPLRTVLDYMERYRSCCGRVPVGHFLEVMPRIQPRYYSIATDRNTHPEHIQIYVRVQPGGLAGGFLAEAVDVGVEEEEEEVQEGEDGAVSCSVAGGASKTDVTIINRENGKYGNSSSSSGSGSSSTALALLAGFGGADEDIPVHRRSPRPRSTTAQLWLDPSYVFAFIRVSTFHLPTTTAPTAPILMIGPGTGAAAMVGLLYRREALMRRQPGVRFGECVFFFGARHAESEFFVRDEVERWSMNAAAMAEWDAGNPNAPLAAAARHAQQQQQQLSSPVLTLLECAFSRDQPEKVYVTDLVKRHGDMIYDKFLSSSDGIIYLSGDAAAMAKDVDRALVSVIQSRTKKGRLAALAVLQGMEGERRYLKDVY